MAREFGISRSEARRLIDQGGVTLGEEPLAAGEHDVPVERADGQVLKVGRRRFRRLVRRLAPGPLGALYSPVGPKTPLGAGLIGLLDEGSTFSERHGGL